MSENKKNPCEAVRIYKEGNRYTEETFNENEKKICF